MGNGRKMRSEVILHGDPLVGVLIASIVGITVAAVALLWGSR